MEVHAPTNPSTIREPQGSGHRKKRTHYFSEFLISFFAVFCGFLAENFRAYNNGASTGKRIYGFAGKRCGIGY